MVQRRGTENAPNVRDLSYKERIATLNITVRVEKKGRRGYNNECSESI